MYQQAQIHSQNKLVFILTKNCKGSINNELIHVNKQATELLLITAVLITELSQYGSIKQEQSNVMRCNLYDLIN